MERALSGLARITSRKSTKDLPGMAHKDYPATAEAYELLDDCGRGVSATVHRALCKPLHDVVAIKKMNLESLNCDLDEIINEAQTMKAYNHPNVLPLYVSFVSGQDLWMVMPFVSGGSVLHIMKYAYPEGLDEVMIATIMRDVLRALEYVHKQGGIHRDIKAGNILIDNNGHVQLGDFGVAASMERTGSWDHDKVARMTFVGTPCWMAPEVMEQTQGYNSSADLWSFGISLLEMAHGHAPFAKFPPMKVLLMTLQNPPPTLDDRGKKHFSKAMRDVVSRCLQKDPRLRPTATQLLEHKFFKQGKDEEFLAKHLMAGLPPLGERVQEIRQGKAATNAQDNDKNFARSQDEYKKGISSWNFDVQALKTAAANEPDDDLDEPVLPTITEADEQTESTLSGVVAAQAAAFVSAQQVAQAGDRVEPGNSNTSAFASLQGQQHLLQTALGGAAGQLQPLSQLLPSSEVASGSTDLTGTGATEPRWSVPDSIPVSPGAGSPPGLSREGSTSGAVPPTPAPPVTSSKQKIKQQGRFQIYEPGSQPPPMSDSPNAATSGAQPTPQLADPSQAAKGSQGPSPEAGSLLAAPGGNRNSEDGSSRSRLDAQDSTLFDNQDTMGVEPKRKGRFTIMEPAGAGGSNISLSTISGNLGAAAAAAAAGALPKVQSAANLGDAGAAGVLGGVASRLGPAGAGGAPLGKPPVPPTPTASAGGGLLQGGGSTLLLPRLQELLEHAQLHAAAVGKLVAAVQESERPGATRLPAVLARGLPGTYRSLFVDLAPGTGSVGTSGVMSSSPAANAAGSKPAQYAGEVLQGPGVAVSMGDLQGPQGDMAGTDGGALQGGSFPVSPAASVQVDGAVVAGGYSSGDEARGLKLQLEAMRVRLAELESVNAQLLARNMQLQAAAAASGASATPFAPGSRAGGEGVAAGSATARVSSDASPRDA